MFDVDHETYGYRRIHVVLTRSGEQVSPDRVRQLMREMGLQSVQPMPWRPTTTLAGDPGDLPDLVEGFRPRLEPHQ
ncbi:IS3 family transposase [Actinomadura geliboluensis]